MCLPLLQLHRGLEEREPGMGERLQSRKIRAEGRSGIPDPGDPAGVSALLFQLRSASCFNLVLLPATAGSSGEAILMQGGF